MHCVLKELSFLFKNLKKKKKSIKCCKEKKNPFFLFQEAIHVFFLIARSVSTLVFYIKPMFIAVQVLPGMSGVICNAQESGCKDH